MWSIAGLWPATLSQKYGQHWLSHMWIFGMKQFWDECSLDETAFGWKYESVLDESVIGWNRFWMKVSLDEIVFGWKCILPTRTHDLRTHTSSFINAFQTFWRLSQCHLRCSSLNSNRVLRSSLKVFVMGWVIKFIVSLPLAAFIVHKAFAFWLSPRLFDPAWCNSLEWWHNASHFP